ncbi:MAG TPA: hypothetical protein VF549_03640 [Solirubrobacteraceae bacterium]
MSETDASRGRLAAAMTLAAAVYGVAATLVWGTQFGGGVAYAIYAQPIAVSALLFVLLRLRCTYGSPTASFAAWTLASLFLAWSVLGALSLAAGSFPAATMLVAAVALTPRGDRGACAESRLV